MLSRAKSGVWDLISFTKLLTDSIYPKGFSPRLRVVISGFWLRLCGTAKICGRVWPWPRYLVLFAVLIAGCFASAQDDSSSQSRPSAPETTIKVRVDLVTLDAQVLNKKTRRPVDGLTPDDFRLFDDGSLQHISSLSRDELPLSVVFLFDLTDSVRPVLKSLAEGALQALQHLKPEDEAAVMVYAASATMLQNFTTDRELLAAAIDKASRMESGEAAFFNEGIFEAATEAGKSDKRRRRVIIWLTDNVPNIPSDEIRNRYGQSLAKKTLHTQNDAVTKLFSTGTVVFTVLQRSQISEERSMAEFNHPMLMLERRAYPPGDVYKYTQQTGGEVLETYSSKKISVRMAELIDSIRSRYALSYHPPANGQKGFHEIRLDVSPQIKQREGKLLVEAKRGYYR
jgi:VWFA-related protein